jgi:hypothetical protein
VPAWGFDRGDFYSAGESGNETFAEIRYARWRWLMLANPREVLLPFWRVLLIALS